MKISLPEHIPGLLETIPKSEQPQGEEEAKFWRFVAHELGQLLTNAASFDNAEVVFNDVRVAGSQYIWEFYVNNLSKEKRDEVNWHGQNASQWVYAGGLLVQGGCASLHH